MSLVVSPSPGQPLVCRTEGPSNGTSSSPRRGTTGRGPMWDIHMAASVGTKVLTSGLLAGITGFVF